MRAYPRLLMLFLALGLCAMAPADEVPVARFAGRVVDAGGRPVAGARLWLEVLYANRDYSFFGQDLGATDADGRFAAEVPQTPLRFGPDGRNKRPWPKRWRYLVAAWEPDRGAGWARAERDAEVEVRMARPASLRGQVVGADGTPQADVSVGLRILHVSGGEGAEETFGMDGPSPHPPWSHTQTDANGRFELRGWPAGASAQVYLAPPEARGHEWGDEWPPDLGEVKLTAPARELTIRLVATPTIAGWLTRPDREKTPAAHISIRAIGRRVTDLPGSERTFRASTDDRGRYRFVHLIPGIYTLWVERGRYTRVVARDVEVVEDQRLELPPVMLQRNVWVEGRVLDADTGAPVAGAGLIVSRRDIPRSSPALVGQDGKTGPDGWFRAKAPPTKVIVSADGMRGDYRGVYRVERVVADGRTWLRVRPGGRKRSYQELSLKPGPGVTGITLYLKRCAVLTGRVIAPDGQAWRGASGGWPLDGERVQVALDWDKVQSRWYWLSGGVIRPDGSFVAGGLYPGVPVVLIVFDDYTEVGGALRVTPELDRSAEVVIWLQPTARVMGRVVMPNGEPVGDASVAVTHVAAAHGNTDAAGHFDLPGGIPGLLCTVSAQVRSDTDRKLLFSGVSKTVEVAPGQEVVDVGDITLAPRVE
jgi:hypothetical protein